MLKSKLILALSFGFIAAALFAGEAELWSSSFEFSGKEIKQDEALLLKTTDRIAYSSVLANGEPESLKIEVTDVNDPFISATLFSNASGRAVEGSFFWDYTQPEYDDFNQFSTYLITETVKSSRETKAYPRTINLVPEPAVAILLAIAGSFVLRRRVKTAAAAFAALAAFASFNAQAYCYVTKIDCLQLFPFSRSVVVNYSVESESAEYFDISFYGTLDDGVTTFDLSEKGELSLDGAEGLLTGVGDHKTLWMPDESFYDIESGPMKVKVLIKEREGLPAYYVYDLETGKGKYLDEAPSEGWTDEYKTAKMPFALIPAGTFTMGSPITELGREGQEDMHSVTLTKSFYMGVFEVTQKQYELIAGSNPSLYTGETRPVENVSYNSIRGADKGALWPASSEVDDDSFLGKFRAQTGKGYDLPTDAQWEYACRAETTSALNSGKNLTDPYECPNMAEVGRYAYNVNDGKGGISNKKHTVVGCYLPNAWGLYDMHGNVSEMCLDWSKGKLGTESVTDPKGPDTGQTRLTRGGSFIEDAELCRSAARAISIMPSASPFGCTGFRLVLTAE